MTILHVLTACSRPENLPTLARNIKESFRTLDVKWHCHFDMAKVGPEVLSRWCPFFASTSIGKSDCAGNPLKNRCLDQCADGWVLGLDDDNVIHPGFEDAFLRALAAHPTDDGFIFGQRNKDDSLLHPPYPDWHRESGHLDLAQYVLRRKLIGSTRFRDGVYDSDWHFIHDVCNSLDDFGGIVLINEPVTYYNALRPRRESLVHEERVPGNGGLGDDATMNRVGGLFDLLDSLPKRDRGRVVEVGSYRGVSTECLALMCDFVVAVDTFAFSPIEKEFQERMRYYPTVSTLKMDSLSAATAFPDGHFDLVYIDAGHSHDEVVADIRAWKPKVRPGGVIAGHDHHPSLPGVVSAVNQELGRPERVFSDFSWMVRKT